MQNHIIITLNYDLYKERKAQLEAEGKKAEQNIGGKIQAFQKKIEAFQRKVMETQQKAQDIAPVELKKLESAFAQEQQKLAAEEASLAKQKDEAGLALEKKLGGFVGGVEGQHRGQGQ